jgi:hypothetical protein
VIYLWPKDHQTVLMRELLDVRGDRIPAGQPLHAYGRWFNNVSAVAHDNLIQTARDASGCTWDIIRVTRGNNCILECMNAASHALHECMNAYVSECAL